MLPWGREEGGGRGYKGKGAPANPLNPQGDFIADLHKDEASWRNSESVMIFPIDNLIHFEVGKLQTKSVVSGVGGQGVYNKTFPLTVEGVSSSPIRLPSNWNLS